MSYKELRVDLDLEMGGSGVGLGLQLLGIKVKIIEIFGISVIYRAESRLRLRDGRFRGGIRIEASWD